MRFYKQVWGIFWEFNSIGEYVWFVIGRIIGTIIFLVGMYLFVTCDSSDVTNQNTTDEYEVIPASVYEY